MLWRSHSAESILIGPKVCTQSSWPPVMSARENFLSFYRTQHRRFLQICRRVSQSSTSISSEEDSHHPVSQHFAEGTAYLEALPAFPTSAQIAQRGGSVLYRQRDQDETEPILLPAGCPPQQNIPVQARLTSLSNGQAETVAFHNWTTRDAVVLWLNYSGHEVAYLRLGPGRFQWLQTFRNHPWIFRDATNGLRLCTDLGRSHPSWQEVVYASDGIQPTWSAAFPGGMRIIEIKEPPCVIWSLEAHKAFPASFRAATATFLMCHHVGGRQLSGPSERHGVCTLSDLPLDLMVKVIGMASPEDVWQQGACKHAEGRQAVGAARVPGPLTQQEQEMLLSTVRWS